MKRTAKKLSALVEKRLNAYSLAAAAAGAGALYFTSQAEAKIVYTPANVQIAVNKGMYWLDVNHDGIPDFGLINRYDASSRGAWIATVNVVALNPANEFLAKQRFDGYWASALQKGAKIGSSGNFDVGYSSAGIMVLNGRSFTYGYWRSGTSYLGFKFAVQGNTHYGWARVKITPRTPHGYNTTLTGYAYETIANKAIVTGRTAGKNVIEAQPKTLGGLARGK